MYGLAMNLIVSVSGHPWIINEIYEKAIYDEISGNLSTYAHITKVLLW